MLLIGAKGHASEILDILIRSEINEDIFLFDNISKLKSDKFLGFTVIKKEEEVEELFSKQKHFALALGGTERRYKLYKKFSALGGQLISIVSEKASISKYATIKEGLNVMSFASVFGNAIIGKGVLLNSYSSVHHDTYIGDFSEISPGARILGNVKIGKFCAIGSNAVILPGLEIGDNVVVGAGSVVTTNLQRGVYVGVPARKIK